MEIIEFHKSKYKGYTLIEGFPSPDLSATITTKYLIESLKMEKIGFFSSDELYPVVRIQNGLPEHPIRIYKSTKHKLLAILSDQLVPKELITDYCNVLINWVKEKKISKIITIASIHYPHFETTKVFTVANHLISKKTILKKSLEVLKEGIITGISARLLLNSTNIPIYLMLGVLSNKTSYDVAGKIIDHLNVFLDLEIDSTELYLQSEKIIKQIQKQMLEVESKKTNDKKNNHMMYV